MSTTTHPYLLALAVLLRNAASVPVQVGDDVPLGAKLQDHITAALADTNNGKMTPDSAIGFMQRIAGVLNQLREKGYTISTGDPYKAPDFAEMRKNAAGNAFTATESDRILQERHKSELDAKIDMLTSAFAQKNAELIAETSQLRDAADLTDAELRAAMLLDFAIRGEKQIDDGLSIRINTEYDFEDKDAVAFAIDRKMPELLKPDRTSFKKQMKLTPQPFCDVSQTASTVVSLKPTEDE